MKNFLFAAALLSLALATGCAVGGSGPCVSGCATITLTNVSSGIDNVNQAPIGGSVAFTAAFQNTSQNSVAWSLSGTSCSGSATSSSNPCGYFTATTATTATYQAPSTVPSSAAVTVVATAQGDSSLTGTDALTVVGITTAVTPSSPNVGVGLPQQFTAVAVPDNAPQTFGTWTCTYGTSATQCANALTACPNVANKACFVYTPASSEECGNKCVEISAPPATDPSECTSTPADCTAAQPVVVANRVSGNYAFQFSGYDNNGNQVLVAGTFTATAGANGSATISGYEDETTSSGLSPTHSFTGGLFTPTSNNGGTLALNLSSHPSTYRVVLDGSGDVQMIEADSGYSGFGSGIAEPVSGNNKFNGAAQNFAFGFTGGDASGNRVGYAGLLQTNGSGTVTGLMDVNDNGSSSNSICSPSAAPCNVAGTYQQNGNGYWTLALTSPVAMAFDFYVANGSANSNSLTLYAISTDSSSNPTVLGTMAMQNPKLTYNNAAFSNTSVSALTGTGGNVALILGTTDGTSSGTGGTGNFLGQFDQNNAGTILTVSAFPSPTQTTNPYTYVATNNNTGRYVFYMLGNPSASTAVPPIPFTLYASGANSGFLLDQSSNAVMTGTMTSQQAPKQNDGIFVPASMPGTYAVATSTSSLSSNSSCSVVGYCAIVMNLLLTSPGGGTFNATGTEILATSPVDLTYNMQSQGVGSFSPVSPAKTPNYVFYATTGTDFFVIEEDSGVPSPILFMAQ